MCTVPSFRLITSMTKFLSLLAIRNESKFVCFLSSLVNQVQKRRNNSKPYYLVYCNLLPNHILLLDTTLDDIVSSPCSYMLDTAGNFHCASAHALI